MYKAMVIDDEPWVIRTLLDSIKWSDYEFEIVATACNSIEGFDMIRSLTPDLVFIDIRMPEMNGLECIKRAKDLKLKTLFIVVSGFAEFSYAQKCMQLGAVGYCLKPIDEDEIVPLMKKVKEELDQRQSQDPPALMDWIMEDRTDTRSRIEGYLAGIGMNPAKNRILRVVCLVGGDGPAVLNKYRCTKLYQGCGKQFLLVQDDSSEPIYGSFLSKPAGSFKGVGISSPIHGLERLKFAVEEAELAAHHYFLTGKPTVYQVEDEQRKDPRYSDFRDLSPALQRRDMTELDRLFDLYLKRLSSGHYHLKHALLLYHTVMTAVVHSGADSDGQEHYLIHDYELLVERYQDIEEMIKDLKRMTIAYLGNMFAGSPSAIRSDSFKAIVQFVHDHSHEEITLHRLSDTFYMNPNYISQLFLKHLGKSFTAYLAELRIRSACHKLKSSGRPIQEIAGEVGIHDPYYFSKMFRKLTGMSPREYRGAQ